MRFKFFFVFSAILIATAFSNVKAQSENEKLIEFIIEKLIENEESTGDYLDLYDYVSMLLQKPVNINKARKDELLKIPFVSETIANAIINYRELNGDFIALYELQVLPEIDYALLEVVVNFFTLDADWDKDQTPLKEMFKQASGEWLSLYQQTLQRSSGYIIADTISETNTQSHYKGAPFRLVSRFHYAYGTRLSFGFNAEKDAGEEFFKGSAKQGFDFYSAHFFLSDYGKIKSLALGDYQVAFGQGLTIGTGLGFGKSALVTSVKRNYSGFRRYRALNENEFMRGAALTYKLGKFDVSGFYTNSFVDASIVNQGDTNLFEVEEFGSFQSTGLHRTASEITNKNNLRRIGYGGNITYKNKRLSIGGTAAHFEFDKLLSPNTRLYNQYAMRGKNATNFGLHYSIYLANANFFGEVAQNVNGGTAMLHGLLMGLGTKADFAMLYRNYGKDYNTLFGNAFGESSQNNNEKGLYTSLSIRPNRKWAINAYYDLFQRDWLAYLVDAPSKGNDALFEVQHIHSRKVSFYLRLRHEEKKRNSSLEEAMYRSPVDANRQSARLHASYQLNDFLTLRTRFEAARYQLGNEPTENGAMAYQDIVYKPMGSKVSVIARFAVFNVDDFYARIFAYENDVLYSFSVPGFQDEGSRYYLILKYKHNRNFDIWIRYASTRLANEASFGSGLDTIYESMRSDIKVQVRIKF
jgi:hypothetical protein